MTLEQQGIDSIEVGIGFGAYATDYTFIYEDVTPYVRSISITRGKTDDFQDFSAGTATVVLDNRDRRFDPSYAAGPHYGLLNPRTRIIIKVTDMVAPTTHVLFSGFIGGWPQDYDINNKEATVSLPCYDALALVSQIEMPTDPAKAIVLSYSDPYTRFYRFGDFTQVGDTVFDSANQTTAYVGDGPGSPSGLPADTVVVGPELAPELNGTSSFFAGGTSALKVYVRNLQTIPDSYNSAVFGGWIRIDSNVFDYLSNPSSFYLIRCGSYRIGLTGAGKIYVYDMNFSTVMAQSTQSIVDGEPRHIMFHYNGVMNICSIYINGVDDTDPASIATGNPYMSDDIQFLSNRTQFYLQDWVFFIEPSNTVVANFNSFYANLFYGTGINQAEMTTYQRFNILVELAELGYNWIDLEAEANYKGTCLEFNVNSKSLLQTLQDVARTEQGFLYCNAGGKITFTGRYTIAESILGSPAVTFTDDPALLPVSQSDPAGALAVGYSEFGYDYDDAQLANDTQVVIGSGDSSSYQDTTSITTLGKKSHSIDTLLGDTTSGKNMAEGLTNIYKDPQLRLKELRVVSYNNYSTELLLGLDIADMISTRRLPQGIGSAIQEYLTVLQIRHEITPSSWSMGIYASARPLNAFFILDHSELDGPDILGF